MNTNTLMDTNSDVDFQGSAIKKLIEIHRLFMTVERILEVQNFDFELQPLYDANRVSDNQKTLLAGRYL